MDLNAEKNIEESQPLTPSSSNMTGIVENYCGPNLDEFPDEVLLYLFSYLNASDLYNLSRCNRRLEAVCSDRKFWREVYDVCNGCSPLHIRLRRFLNDSTTTIYLSESIVSPSNQMAKECENLCFRKNFLESLSSLSDLKTFILENHTFSYENLNLVHLPGTLTQLILNRVHLLKIPEQNEIFNDIHASLPNLEVIDVSHCLWVTPELLIPLSKCPNLKKLVMIECTEMRNIAFYADITTNCGFSKLKALDLRLTYVTFDEISIFRKLKNLKHVLLEKPAEGRIETVTRNLRQVAGVFHSILADFSRSMFASGALPLAYGGYHDRFNLTDYVNTWLETLVVRNYTDIDDLTLGEIEAFFISLRYLDVTHTGCTAERVAVLQIRCPEIRVLHDSISESTEFLIDINS